MKSGGRLTDPLDLHCQLPGHEFVWKAFAHEHQVPRRYEDTEVWKVPVSFAGRFDAGCCSRVFAANNIGDALLGIVNDDGKLVGP